MPHGMGYGKKKKGNMTDADMGGQGTGQAYMGGESVGGPGVQHASNDMAADGHRCEAKFPLKGGFFTRKPKHGQA